MTDLVYFTFQHKTIFVPFRYLYPECLVLIEGQGDLYPLNCLRGSCRVDQGCMEIVAKRVSYWFTHLEPAAKLLIAYFSYADKPKSVRAGIFTQDLREPRLSTLNRSAFDKFRRESITKQWSPSAEYTSIRRDTSLIPITNLVQRGERTWMSQ